MTRLSEAVSAVLRGMVRAYQLAIAPVLPASCRYHPSCSNYAFEALGRHGAVVGSWLALCRIVRCHPWGGGGVDPVPPRRGGDAPAAAIAWRRSNRTGGGHGAA